MASRDRQLVEQRHHGAPERALVGRALHVHGDVAHAVAEPENRQPDDHESRDGHGAPTPTTTIRPISNVLAPNESRIARIESFRSNRFD